jgi:EthD domain
MVKILWLIKRKAGVTPEQFRERYERHARLGLKIMGHLMCRYRRNYQLDAWGGGTPTTHDGSTTFGVVAFEYDCISEVCFPTEEAYNERLRVFADPLRAKQFYDDEEDFLDRKSVIMVRCEEVETDIGGGA